MEAAEGERESWRSRNKLRWPTRQARTGRKETPLQKEETGAWQWRRERVSGVSKAGRSDARRPGSERRSDHSTEERRETREQTDKETKHQEEQYGEELKIQTVTDTSLYSPRSFEFISFLS